MTRLALLLLPAALLLALVVPALADEAPAAAEPEAAPSPHLRLEDLDLLPLGEFEMQDLRAEHPELVQRLQGLAYQLRQREKSLAGREKKDDEGGRKLQANIDGIRQTAAPLLLAATDRLRAHGLTDATLAEMARAPRGAERLGSYTRRLVLLLDDLSAEQHAIFARVVHEVDGAALAAKALERRTRLALKQAGLEDRAARGVLAGFRRQTQETERRFWRLVDYVLEDDQKATLWEMFPASFRRHDSAVDHVYALPGLTPAQGARVRALVTEIEAESAPDQALVKRVQVRLRAKDLTKEERQALAKERSDAYARLNALKRRAHDVTLEILTDAQVHAMKAIPPRVSINDRRANGKRVLQGMEFDARQQAQLALLRKEGQEAGRRYQAKVRELRKEGAEIGPDAPEQMMMQMMMAGAAGEAQAAQRRLLGRVFREVLTPEQVSAWVMGDGVRPHYSSSA